MKRNGKTKLFIFISAALVLIAAGLLLYFFKGSIIKNNSASDNPYEETAAYVVKNTEPAFGLEWVALSLHKGNYECGREWLSKYKSLIENEIVASYNDNTQLTTYERCIITLCALGMNPENVGDLNLTEKLYDEDAVKERGLNSIIYAVIALDVSGGDKELTDRYIDEILSRQHESGGFGLNPNVPDVDITAMTLQAISSHRDREDVQAAVDRAIAFLCDVQKDNGEFATMGQPNSQSLSQVILALDALGISPDDARFVKDGKTLLDVLDMYKREDGGYARMLTESEPMLSATIQVLEALTAVNTDGAFFG